MSLKLHIASYIATALSNYSSLNSQYPELLNLSLLYTIAVQFGLIPQPHVTIHFSGEVNSNNLASSYNYITHTHSYMNET